MDQINSQKFGLFIAELRKDKNWTQKELAEKLYVSDKTVSKWERGVSIPNVALLMPIADTLGVTVTELLRGERTDAEESSGLLARDFGSRNRKRWIAAYVICFAAAAAEVIILAVSGLLSIAAMKHNVLPAAGLMLLFGGWFCLFAKDLLPSWYDRNKINYVSQGFCRIHMPGLTFNNGNWPYICVNLKIWTLAAAVLYPLACILILNISGPALWNQCKNILPVGTAVGMMASTYIVGKKYE